MDMNEIIKGVKLTKVFQVSPDEDSKKTGISKQVTVEMSYEGLTIKDIFTKALSHDIIPLQAELRKSYSSLVDRSTIKRSAKSPGVPLQKDPMEALIEEANSRGIKIEELISEKIAALKK